jgi:hypothetical protein
VHVVEPRRGVGLAERHLQDAADERDRRHPVQADLHGALAGWHGVTPTAGMLAQQEAKAKPDGETELHFVMAGLVPAIHVLLQSRMGGGWVYFMTTSATAFCTPV